MTLSSYLSFLSLHFFGSEMDDNNSTTSKVVQIKLEIVLIGLSTVPCIGHAVVLSPWQEGGNVQEINGP